MKPIDSCPTPGLADHHRGVDFHPSTDVGADVAAADGGMDWGSSHTGEEAVG